MPPPTVADRVADQVREHELDPLAIDHDLRRVRQHLRAQLNARPLRPTRAGSRSRRERRVSGSCAAEPQLDPVGLDARQIEQLVDDRLQAIAFLARGEHQIGLLRGQRPDRLLGEQVDRHAQRGQRRAQLVRDRRDQIVAQLLEPMQPRDVLEHDRRADHVALFGIQRRGAGQQQALAIDAGQLDRLVESLRNVRAVARRRRAGASARPHARIAGSRTASAFAPASARALRIVSAAWFAWRSSPSSATTSTGSGRLSIVACAASWASSSSPSELSRYFWIRSAIVLSSTRELADLVAATDACAHRDVAFAEPPRGLTEHAERPQHAGGHDRRRERARATSPASETTTSSVFDCAREPLARDRSSPIIASWFIARIASAASLTARNSGKQRRSSAHRARPPRATRRTAAIASR